MIRSNRVRIGAAVTLTAALALTLVWSARAREKPTREEAEANAAEPSDSKSSESKPSDLKTASRGPQFEESEGQFVVPKGASPKELLRFINKTRKHPAEDEAEMKQMLAAISKAADGILAAKDVDEDMAVVALRYKFMVHATRASMLGDASAVKKAVALANSLKNDERPAVRDLAEAELLKARIPEMAGMDDAGRKQLVDDMRAYLAARKLSQSVLETGMSFARGLEEFGQTAGAADLNDALAKKLRDSGEDDAVRFAGQLEGIARRMRLPGRPLELEGTTVDGKPFDWKSYRGKVVLVDFWATWCGPCVAELPNVLENYRKYRSRGFDVVGISLDDDLDALKGFLKEKRIPWTTLVGKEDGAGGMSHPMAERYGITGIPQVMLVDREGNVIELSIRGPKLGVLLDKLLGDGAKKKPAE